MVYFPNKDDFDNHFWNHNYRVLVSAQGVEFIVNANNAQEAIDYVIDYCEEHLPGLLWDDEALEALRKESLEDYGDERYVDDFASGGNHGRHFSTHNVLIQQL